MAEQRVKRWRETKRQQGLKALTVWFTSAQELRLKDLATTWHCAPSEVLQTMFDQFQPTQAPRISTVPDTDLIRQLIREELTAMQPSAPPVTDPATVTVTDTETPSSPTTPPTSERTSGTVTGNGFVTETSPATLPRKGGRRRSEDGQRILDVLAAHPEGLTAEELRVHAQAKRPIGDILLGMKRRGQVQTHSEGKAMRYTLA
jgi:hypothetical protein